MLASLEKLTLDIGQEGVLCAEEFLEDLEVITLKVVAANLNSLLVAEAVPQHVLAELVVYFLRFSYWVV